MSRRRRSRRGVSLGTVVMLLLTIVVLGGFCALLPRLTGTTDVHTNAAELAVAIDQSLSPRLRYPASLVGPTPQACGASLRAGCHRHPLPAAPTEPPEQRFRCARQAAFRSIPRKKRRRTTIPTALTLWRLWRATWRPT